MIYLRNFSFPSEDREYNFILDEKRTCFDTFYPFKILSKNDFTEIAKKITSISNYATVLKNHSIKTDFFIPLAKFRWTCGDEKCGMPYSLILNSSGKYAKSGWTSHLHDTYELFYFNTQSEVDNLKLLFKNTILPKIIGKI